MEDIENQIKELLSDADFETLCLSLDEANIFRILSEEKKELKHSNFLAYLLNPYDTHGLDELFLMKFIREIFSEKKQGSNRSLLDIADLNFANVQVIREWKNIDILIVMENDVFCIENKINIKDHSGQLSKYRSIVDEAYSNRNRHYIYLTPFGESPQQEGECEYYHNMSYQTIVDILTTIINVYQSKIEHRVFVYLNDYITILNRDILMKDELNDKAAKLYAKYADAIEFIYSNKPDAASELYPYFEKELIKRGFVIGSKNKGCIRFTTPELDQKIAKTGVGWPGKESFMFEIDYYWSDKNATFKAIISPCDKEIKNNIIASVTGKDYYQKPQGEKWVVFCNKSFKFKASEIVNEDKNNIENAVKFIVDKLDNLCHQIAADIDAGCESHCGNC